MLLMEGFRCFAEPQEVPLAPLTFLVGGNSSGKTSFLAAVRLAWDVSKTGGAPDFGEEPFDLGSYRDISSFFGGRGGRAKKFSLGLSLPLTRPRRTRTPASVQQIELKATFTQSSDDHPLLTRQTMVGAGCEIEITTDAAKGSAVIDAVLPSGASVRTDFPAGIEPEQVWWLISFEERRRHQPDEILSLTDADREALQDLSLSVEPMLGSRPVALAPVRARPKRTYDPRTPTLSPEGEHTPMMLSTFLESGGEEQQNLIEFGKASGLFTTLKVRRFGTKGGVPFQLQAGTSGRARNIIDMGYGVSQALPIIVDTLNTQRSAVLLIQQPEVHLHPKAQAEIATFFVEQVRHRTAPIMVETHSDYIIDRARLLIREGAIRSSDVQILFFSPKKTDVEIFPIALDDRGDVVDSPAEYREFFMEEQRRLFSG